jgi:hypothetical protein
MHSGEDKVLFNAVTFGNIYIPKVYVRKGSSDVGVAKVNVTDFDPSAAGGMWDDFSIGGTEDFVGKTVVGHGLVFLSGRVLSYPNTQQKTRIMIGTPSLPGCSGCPLFDNNRNLVALYTAA